MIKNQPFYEEFERANNKKKDLNVDKKTFIKYYEYLSVDGKIDENNIPYGLAYKNITIIYDKTT